MPSGVYTIDPDGTGPLAPISAYCDMTTDDGGWMLMAKFSQNTSINTMSATTYTNYFRANLWIDGFAERIPSTFVPVYDAIHVESLNGSDFMTTDTAYELLQRFFRDTETNTFDVAYRFTLHGRTDQNSGLTADERSWVLSDRRVLTDTSGIAWHTPREVTRFWLPFRSGITGNIYADCSGYYFRAPSNLCPGDPGVLSATYGTAGGMGSTADGLDSSAGWSPLVVFGRAAVNDVVLVQQALSVYGRTGAPMVLLYFVR